MSHFISTIRIKNFKSCTSSIFDLSVYTPLVGYNNAGKSNILTALHWLVSKYNLSITDFCSLDSPVEIEGAIQGITLELLSSLDPKHKKSLEIYVYDEVIYIKRIQVTPGDLKSIVLYVWNEQTQEYTENPTGIDNAIKDIFPEPIRISAMENAEEDATKAKTSTTIGKLLNQIIYPISKQYGSNLNNHLSQIRNKISCDGSERISEFNSIDEQINQKIDNLFPGVSIKLHFDTPSFDELMKKGTIQVYEDSKISRNFSAYGHGAQRSIQMALIQHLAEIQKKPNSKNTTLLLIDEPELYLHPFAIEQIREALKKLSKTGFQVIFSTHSAQMISMEDAPNTLLIRKNAYGTHSRIRLKQAINTLVIKADHQEQHLFTLSHSSQILFAESVILAEGKTELRLLPMLFKKFSSKTLGQCRLALIPLGGAANSKKTLDILKHMDVPAKAIVDLDFIFNDAIQQKLIDKDHPHIKSIRSIFSNLNTGIHLSSTGFPCKGGTVSPSKAYELLSNDPQAQCHIKFLHDEFKKKNIWVWTKGAIENHLNLSNKEESTWALFNQELELKSLQDLNFDIASVRSLVEWIST